MSFVLDPFLHDSMMLTGITQKCFGYVKMKIDVERIY